MTQSRFPLPAYAHVPGRNRRHRDGFADAIIATLPPVVENDACRFHPAFLHSLHLIKKEFFWEAHEVLEAMWMRTPRNSREYHFVQGMIHVANGGLKARMGRESAVTRIRDLAMGCFERSFRPGVEDLMFEMTFEDAIRLLDQHTL